VVSLFGRSYHVDRRSHVGSGLDFPILGRILDLCHPTHNKSRRASLLALVEAHINSPLRGVTTRCQYLYIMSGRKRLSAECIA